MGFLRNKKEQDRKGELTKFIHIGYPKCASTSLQTSYFSRHDKINFFGAGIDGNAIKYKSDLVQRLVEVDIRYSRDAAYDKNLYIAEFSNEFKITKDSNVLTHVGLSSEHFAFAYANDIDTYMKAGRLYDIFGDGTKILIIVRNQWSLLKALYGEHIREGYAGTFNDFIEYTLVFKERNWFYDFCFDKTYLVYKDYFKAENVKIIDFNILKNSSQDFIQCINSFLGLESKSDIQLSKSNPRLEPKELSLLREYNARANHTLQRSFYEPIHLHRYENHLKKYENTNVYKRSRSDLYLQLGLVKTVQQFAGRSNAQEEMYLCSDKLKDEVFQVYNESNQKLYELTGVQLKIE